MTARPTVHGRYLSTSRGAPVRSVLYYNLKRNCSKFSEATLNTEYPLCQQPSLLAPGTVGQRALRTRQANNRRAPDIAPGHVDGLC